MDGYESCWLTRSRPLTAAVVNSVAGPHAKLNLTLSPGIRFNSNVFIPPRNRLDSSCHLHFYWPAVECGGCDVTRPVAPPFSRFLREGGNPVNHASQYLPTYFPTSQSPNPIPVHCVSFYLRRDPTIYFLDAKKKAALTPPQLGTWYSVLATRYFFPLSIPTTLS